MALRSSLTHLQGLFKSGGGRGGRYLLSSPSLALLHRHPIQLGLSNAAAAAAAATAPRAFSAAAASAASSSSSPLPAATPMSFSPPPPLQQQQQHDSRSGGAAAELTLRSELTGGGIYPPIHGGPMYWSLRRGWTSMKRRVRRSNRAWDFNWELSRTAFAGVPKFSYNPKANEWIYLIDNEEWNGVGGRVWIGISMQILYFFHWAFWAYFFYFRALVNGKFDVFGKWKDRVEEAKAAQ